MQVGSFYEAYSVDKIGPDLFKISEILNIVCTKKNKKKDEVSESNPYMLGFPVQTLSKFLKMLIDEQYTVIIIDQTSIDEKFRQVRTVTGVYSQSTYIDNICIENKYLMVFYIEFNNVLNSVKKTLSIGMACIDISIGTVNYYEIHGSNTDNEVICEAQRYYHCFRPVELVIYEMNNSEESIINKLDILPNQMMLTYTKINPIFTKISYLNTQLKNIYKCSTMLSPIEYFNIEKYIYSQIALSIAYDYISGHNETLIKNLANPEYFNDHKYMILGNNAQYQLSIIDYNFIKNFKFQSLNDVINQCVTSIGKREFKERLCAPYTCIKKIENIYNMTDNLIKSDLCTEIRKHLKSVSDIEKLFRKMSINMIKPYELYTIHTSISSIISIINLINDSELKEHFKILGKSDLRALNKCINYLDKTFDISVIKNENFIDITKSFYNVGIHSEIDELSLKINDGIFLLSNVENVFNILDPNCKIQIKNNDRDGYYLQTTVKKCNNLKKIIDKMDVINITEHINILPSDLYFCYLTTSAKITCPKLFEMHTLETLKLNQQFSNLLKKTFFMDVELWNNDYGKLFKKLINYVKIIDVVASNAFTSTKYHYVKPRLIESTDKNGSSIVGKKIRHPIIERIIDHEYVPHDITINDDIKGNLIYGINSSGKSSLMKAVGLCVIMAQCGLFVPATYFEYNIFTSLYTRISGNDNLFKGQSSFMIEMNELRSILKKSNNKTLIIGDEVCRGTEYLSANAIVGSAINKLCLLNTRFLFATHLHELKNLTIIKNLKCIKFFYLSVDTVENELIFNRELKEGTGEQIYGITIAKYILNDPEFIENAIINKNELLKISSTFNKIDDKKTSNYNKDIYMDSCTLCGKKQKLETHHINFQKDFKKSQNGLILEHKKHVLKNDKNNLIVLCDDCHTSLHNKEFKIDSIVMSTKGIVPV